MLRRRNGQWSPHHGNWAYQLELPPKADATHRNPLRRGGFASQDAAEEEISEVVELLGISKVPPIQTKIADLIVATVKTTGHCPTSTPFAIAIRSV